MRSEIRIVGSGGQGIILSGILLTHSIGLYEGLEVAQTQSYGPESRGGACRAEVVVSDERVDYVKVEVPDYLITLNEVSFNKFIKDTRKETIVLVDSTFVGADPSIHPNLYSIPATKMAEEQLKGYVANMVALGAFSKINDIVTLDSMVKAVKGIVHPDFHSINIEALYLGNERMMS